MATERSSIFANIPSIQGRTHSFNTLDSSLPVVAARSSLGGSIRSNSTPVQSRFCDYGTPTSGYVNASNLESGTHMNSQVHVEDDDEDNELPACYGIFGPLYKLLCWSCFFYGALLLVRSFKPAA